MTDTTNPNDPKWMAFVAWAQRRWGSREAWHHTINTCGEWDAWNGALEQQAAQIDALRADAERMRVALNVIAERQSSEWPERCRINVQTARSVLDLIDGIDATLRQEQPT